MKSEKETKAEKAVRGLEEKEMKSEKETKAEKAVRGLEEKGIKSEKETKAEKAVRGLEEKGMKSEKETKAVPMAGLVLWWDRPLRGFPSIDVAAIGERTAPGRTEEGRGAARRGDDGRKAAFQEAWDDA